MALSYIVQQLFGYEGSFGTLTAYCVLFWTMLGVEENGPMKIQGHCQCPEQLMHTILWQIDGLP